MKEKILSPEEFDREFRKALWEVFPEQMATGKIQETPTGWRGLKFKEPKEVKRLD